MKTLQYIKIKPIHSFCDIETKREYKVVEYRENDFVCKSKRMNYVIQYSNVFNYSESQYLRGNFIGTITEIEGGFIPENSLVNYLKYKVYKTKTDAYKFLINKKFESNRKKIFGNLALNQFYYTTNHIDNKSIFEIADELKIMFDLEILNYYQILKIIKKYFKANVIDYAGQGGYKTKTEIFYSSF